MEFVPLKNMNEKCIALFLLILVVIDLSNGSVSWSLTTKPAAIGRDIELHCDLDNDTLLNNSSHWSKGENVKVLMLNGETINDTKYSEKLDEAKRTSILTITSLDTDDVNVPYTCQYGFQRYKKVLNMTVENFEYYPEKGKASFNQKDDHMLFSMTFEKVFPVPNCKALYGDQDITNLLNIRYVPEDVLYKVEINLKYHHVSKECFHHPFELDCCFGTKTIKQRFETANDVCLEMTSALKTDEKPHVSEKDQTLGTVGQVVFGIVFLIYCVIFPITYAYIQYNGC